MTFAAYIIGYGDFVFAETVVRDADEIRQDEKINFNSARSNLISGFRNLSFATLARTQRFAALSGEASRFPLLNVINREESKWIASIAALCHFLSRWPLAPFFCQ
jgi:hypothetical protein